MQGQVQKKKKSMQDFSSVTLIIPSDLFILSKTAT